MAEFTVDTDGIATPLGSGTGPPASTPPPPGGSGPPLEPGSGSGPPAGTGEAFGPFSWGPGPRIGEPPAGTSTIPDAARAGTFTSPAVESDLDATGTAALVSFRTTAGTTVASSLTRATFAAADGAVSGTGCTCAPASPPGQPRNATIALTTTSMRRAAATRIAVVPRLEMYATRARIVGGVFPTPVMPKIALLYPRIRGSRA